MSGQGNGTVFRRKNRAGVMLPTWWIKYYVPGRKQPLRETSGTTDKATARRLLHARLAESAPLRGERLAREDITVGRLLDLVAADYEDHEQTLPRGHLEAWRAVLGGMRAIDLRRDQLDAVLRRWRNKGPTWPGRACWCRRKGCKDAEHRARERPISGGSCNRYRATLSRAFSLGKEKLGLVTPLSFPHFTETTRHKAIPTADFYAIVKHVRRSVVRDVFELAYLNGVRKGQLLRTELSNVDPVAWTITWRGDQTKTGKRTGVPHVLPLVGRSREIVEAAWKRRRPECIFLFHEEGRPLGLLRSEWNRACRKAGFPVGRRRGGYVFHGTRHSAVSNMTASGVPAPVAMSISGHRTTSVFLRYNIVAPDTQRAALAQAEAFVQDARRKASKVARLKRAASA